MSENNVKCPLCGGSGEVEPMVTVRSVTKKMRAAEAWVDEVIKMKGSPPSYQQVADHFGLASSSVAHSRLRHCREKMNKK